ncbi:hypothetical protein BgiBS90_023949, partial [Biomphalaria glabrata]
QPITVQCKAKREPSCEDLWVKAKVSGADDQLDNSFDNSTASSDYDVSIHLK